jgi:transcriptional regulator with XRE-family HTH domain
LPVVSRRDRRYKEIAHRLREARDAAGLTQQAAAAKLGVPQSFISKCEAGERRLDVLELDALAKLYRKALSDFV